MFEGFTRTEIETSGARIHLRHGGDEHAAVVARESAHPCLLARVAK